MVGTPKPSILCGHSPSQLPCYPQVHEQARISQINALFPYTGFLNVGVLMCPMPVSLSFSIDYILDNLIDIAYPEIHKLFRQFLHPQSQTIWHPHTHFRIYLESFHFENSTTDGGCFQCICFIVMTHICRSFQSKYPGRPPLYIVYHYFSDDL